jgi:uncharacterized protein (DUF58 family)
MTTGVGEYLKPEVINQIKRLDLRAQFVVKGFLQGLHASPLHGFSVEFSEHREYRRGDDPRGIDWGVFAKTDKYYIRKYEAETNLTGYIAVDQSQSMGYTYRQDLTKFDYSICLAASLSYLMIGQQDPVGLVTFDQGIRDCLRPKSSRRQLTTMLAMLSRLKPTGQTDVAHSLLQLAGMLKHQSLIMLFTDLLVEPQPVRQALSRLKHGGHDVILFHVLDEAELSFPFEGALILEDPESGDEVRLDGRSMRTPYQQAVKSFQDDYRRWCQQMRIDYVAIDTKTPFDKALIEYLTNRRMRL